MISAGEWETSHAVYPSSNQTLLLPRCQQRMNMAKATAIQVTTHQSRPVVGFGSVITGDVSSRPTPTEYYADSARSKLSEKFHAP
jgi:hypothetical protein